MDIEAVPFAIAENVMDVAPGPVPDTVSVPPPPPTTPVAELYCSTLEE